MAATMFTLEMLAALAPGARNGGHFVLAAPPDNSAGDGDADLARTAGTASMPDGPSDGPPPTVPGRPRP